MNQKVSYDKPIDEVFGVNDLDGKRIEEGPNDLDEIKKPMEEESKAWETPQVEEVKLTKPKASIPMTFEVFALSTPKAKLDEAFEEKKFDLGDEEQMSEKEIEQDKNNPITEKMEVEVKEEKGDIQLARKSKGLKRKHEETANKIREKTQKKGVHKVSSGVQNKMQGSKGEVIDTTPTRNNVKQKKSSSRILKKKHLTGGNPIVLVCIFFLFICVLLFFFFF